MIGRRFSIVVAFSLPAARCMTIMTAPAAATGTTAIAKYETLKKLLRDVNALAEVDGILGYDEQCFMPAGAAGARATQKAALAKVRHIASTGDEMRQAVDSMRDCVAELPTEQMRANVRDAIDGFDKTVRRQRRGLSCRAPPLSREHARTLSHTHARSQHARTHS